jgi:predicted CXXCH cytochrome family protein
MKWFASAILLGWALLAASVDAALPATRAAKPHDSVGNQGCVRDECHADIRRFAVLHGPVAANTCDACHELTDAESHKFKLAREKAELCTFCHEFDLSAMPIIHKPAKDGACIACHDAHGGTTKALLRENSIRETCNRCHEDITQGRTFLHTPVKEGACDSCHPPHASRFPKLLDRAGPDLCLACHESFGASLAAAKFTHKAVVEKGCEKCHDPHGSKFVMSTTQPAYQQCAGCHAKLVADAAAARYPHSPVRNDRACLTCHTPHGGILAKLVADVPEKLCMSCHAKEQKAAGGRVIPAAAELMSPGTKHGGIKDGSCAGCHAAHGGERQLFLAKNYSSLFYQRFANSNYGLCFGCHDARLVTDGTTTKLTAFRNGDRNLHSVHVRETQERGENCRVCHPTHAAAPGDQGLIRDSARFGAWNLPIRFKKTPTGGSCYPGCHPQYGYDRQRAIRNAVGRATTLPASMPIARERPARIALETRDIGGATVTIPAGNRPVVMLLVRADQPSQENRALNLLQAALKDRGDVGVIVVRTGVEAIASPPTTPATTHHSIVADVDGSISSELDVHGWPTLLVITGSGVELARMSASETTAMTLPAYADLAAGKMPSTRPQGVVGAEPFSKSARDVRRIEYLIDSGKAGEALKLLMNLPDAALPPWRHNLLGARALAMLNRWPEAKDAAEAALTRNPGLPEAHFVLGQYYEHAQNWPRAAAEYRAATSGPEDQRLPVN